MSTQLPINLDALLRQCAIEDERVEYRARWNDDRLSFEVHLPVRAGADWGGLLDTPYAGEQAGEQVGEQVPPRVRKLLSVLEGELHREELQERVEIKSRPFFLKHFLAPALEARLVEMTDPASPNSPQQRYRLTPLGRKACSQR